MCALVYACVCVCARACMLMRVCFFVRVPLCYPMRVSSCGLLCVGFIGCLRVRLCACLCVCARACMLMRVCFFVRVPLCYPGFGPYKFSLNSEYLVELFDETS